MRPPRLLVVTGLAVALAAAALVAAPATATVPTLPILLVGTAPANVGDQVNAVLSNSTQLQLTIAPVSSSSFPTGLKCSKSTWQGQVLNNPFAPGPASIQLTAPLQFLACTDNNPTVNAVNGVGVSGLPAPLLISSATPSFPIQILPFNSPLQIVVSLATTAGPANCVYRSTGVVNGSTTSGTNPWDFTNQPFALVSGPSLPCGVTGVGFLNASYTVFDSTAGTNLALN